MSNHNKVNYLEIPTRNIAQSKIFFSDVFGWSFTDYGPDYCSFSNQGIDGGFYQAELTVSIKTGSPLIVIYSSNLEETRANIEANGGTIIKPIFSFPGGKRFHFTEPCGNEFAVWSE